MTDRIHAFTIVLDQTYREDDVESIQTALRMVRGVLSVTPHVADVGTYSAYERARADLYKKVFEALAPQWVKEVKTPS